MRFFYLPLLLILSLVVNQGCNTLYNTRTIEIEIAEPGKVKFPEAYRSIAVRNNNCNVSLNPLFARIVEGERLILDTTNLDSVAAEVYFDLFLENILKEQFFDSVHVLDQQKYSNVKIIDTIDLGKFATTDSAIRANIAPEEYAVASFAGFLKKYPISKTAYTATGYLDPEFGLYSEKKLKQIADTTGADVLLSLDYFATIDGIHYMPEHYSAYERVHVFAYWNLYDLHERKLKTFFDRNDTINWIEPAYSASEAAERLPPRRDAVLNAADIAGSRFAHFLVPHWIKVERVYYRSGHVDLKKTDRLVDEGRWMEAAGIWKANVDNPNKSIAAKSMFNMGLACEMQGEIDAAIDWVVKSFYVFGQKNPTNFENCMQYIRILSQRKLDIKTIEHQLNLN